MVSMLFFYYDLESLNETSHEIFFFAFCTTTQPLECISFAGSIKMMGKAQKSFLSKKNEWNFFPIMVTERKRERNELPSSWKEL